MSGVRLSCFSRNAGTSEYRSRGFLRIGTSGGGGGGEGLERLRNLVLPIVQRGRADE